MIGQSPYAFGYRKTVEKAPRKGRKEVDKADFISFNEVLEKVNPNCREKFPSHP